MQNRPPNSRLNHFPLHQFPSSKHTCPIRLRKMPFARTRTEKNIYGQLIIGPRKRESWHVREREAFGSINKIQSFLLLLQAFDEGATQRIFDFFPHPNFNAPFQSRFSYQMSIEEFFSAKRGQSMQVALVKRVREENTQQEARKKGVKKQQKPK